jgi:putative hydrolase of the HAD superfamily
MTFRGVIFDLFHTLTAAESQWSDLPWTADALGVDRRVWNDALMLRSRWRLTGEVRDGVEIVRRLARDIDPAIPEEIIARAAAFRQERFHRALVNIPPGNLRVISELRDRGLSLALCSNADASEIAAWGVSPLSGRFDAEIFSCQVGAVKPEAMMYDLCLNRLGLSARECVFVGDGGSNELVGSRQAGLYSVFFSGVMEELWPERIPALLQVADVHIRTLSELLLLPGLSQG